MSESIRARARTYLPIRFEINVTSIVIAASGGKFTVSRGRRGGRGKVCTKFPRADDAKTAAAFVDANNQSRRETRYRLCIYKTAAVIIMAIISHIT